MRAKVSRARPESGFLGLLRGAALIAVLAGAVGSLGFLLREGRRTPRFLLLLFVLWVLSPFVALAWANMVSNSWTVLTRATLYCVTIVLTLGSLAIYGDLILPPAGSPLRSRPCAYRSAALRSLGIKLCARSKKLSASVSFSVVSCPARKYPRAAAAPFPNLSASSATASGVILANTASFGTEEVSNHTI